VEYCGEQLPSYNDPAYGCEMELLRFDWRHPNPRFLSLVKEVEAELMESPIISSSRHRPMMRHEPSNISDGFLGTKGNDLWMSAEI
jgi:hypothetical protein